MLELLTEAELYELTKYKLGKYQLAWLRENGFKAIMGRDGIPLVLRSHIESVLSPKVPSEKSKAQPDWAALEAKLNKNKRGTANAKEQKPGKRVAA
jgi:hypothetical protein